MKTRFVYFALATMLATVAYSQPLSVEPILPGDTTLVGELLDNALTDVFNIQFTGDPVSYGIFSKENSNFSLPKGIILTSGDATFAMGPNNSAMKSFNNSGSGFPLLDSLNPYLTNDASILEFDLVSCDTVYSLSIVFGSEEYPEWVGTAFIDPFGLFVSGANPNGNNYMNQNFALVPSTSFPINIDNINTIANSFYYVDNGTGTTPTNETLQYDGYTVVINIDIPIVPGEVYHIILAIADAGDSILDSGVLFCANPATATMNEFSVSLETAYGFGNQLFEGYPASLHFEKCDSLNLTSDFVIHLDLVNNPSGATPGLDYAALPDSVLIPAGNMSFDLPLTIIADGLTETDEWLFLNCIDSCQYGGTLIQAQIFDDYVFSAGIEPGNYDLCDGASFYLNTYANAADSMVSYLWSTGSTDQSIFIPGNVSSSIEYFVTISHSDGYVLVDSVTVSVSPVMILDLDYIAGPCDFDAIYLTVSGGTPPFAYSWSNGSTTQDLLQINQGTYSVLVTDSYGCMQSDSLTSNSPGPIFTTLSAQSYCTDSLGALSIEASNGTPPYTFLWNTGSTDAVLDSIPAGDYFVTVTDFWGCTEIDSMLGFYPVPPSVTVNYSTDGCLPSYASVQVSGGSAPFSIEWSTGQTGNEEIINNSGLHWVHVADAAGCEFQDTFIIVYNSSISLDVSATIALDSCSSTPGTIDLTIVNGVLPVTYNWSHGATTQDLDSLAPGFYSVTIVDANNCYLTQSYNIPSLPQLTFEFGYVPITNCQTLHNGFATVIIYGSQGPVSYNWSTGSTDNFIDSLAPGNYYVTVSDNCTTRVDTTTIDYQFSTPFSLHVTNANCNDSTGKVWVSMVDDSELDSMYLTHTGSSQIYHPLPFHQFDSLPAGDYTFTLVDTFGCTSTDSLQIEFIPSFLSATIDTAFCPGYLVTAAATVQSTNNNPSWAVYSIQFPSFDHESLSGGTNVANPLIDDRYWGPFPIGFDFEFFGNPMSNFYVGSNGWVSFSPLSNPTFDPWVTQAIPNTDPAHPRNAIFALYRDWYPGTGGNGSIKYFITGTAPYRKLVVNYVDVPLFSCTNSLGTFQVVLHETSDIVDVNIIGGPTCSGWNSGNGVMGIQNEDGTVAYSLPGKNNEPFEVFNYSVRYNPQKPLWYDPMGNLITEGAVVDFNADIPGIYTCEAFTPCGLETFEIDVQFLYDFTIDLGPDQLLCPGDSILLQLPPTISGNWSTGFTDTALWANQPGEYSVQVSLANGYCNWSDTVFITHELIDYFTSFDTTICPGDTVVVEFDPAYSYQWANGSTNNWLLVSDTSTYYVTVSLLNCTMEDTVELSPGFYPSPITVLPNDTAKCPGISLLLDGGNEPTYTYHWNNGSLTDTTIIVTLGLYTVTITDNLGCQIVDAVLVGEQAPVSSGFQFFEAFNHVQFVNQSQNAYSYIWDFGDWSELSYQENPEHDYPVWTQDAWYTITLVAFNQCGSDTSYRDILIFDIEELEGNSTIQIFPNPNQGNFFLSGILESKDDLKLSIFNSTGQEIYQKEISSIKGKISEEIGLGQVAAGLYFLRIQQKENRWVWKMVVE